MCSGVTPNSARETRHSAIDTPFMNTAHHIPLNQTKECLVHRFYQQRQSLSEEVVGDEHTDKVSINASILTNQISLAQFKLINKDTLNRINDALETLASAAHNTNMHDSDKQFIVQAIGAFSMQVGLHPSTPKSLPQDHYQMELPLYLTAPENDEVYFSSYASKDIALAAEPDFYQPQHFNTNPYLDSSDESLITEVSNLFVSDLMQQQETKVSNSLSPTKSIWGHWNQNQNQSNSIIIQNTSDNMTVYPYEQHAQKAFGVWEKDPQEQFEAPHFNTTPWEDRAINGSDLLFTPKIDEFDGFANGFPVIEKTTKSHFLSLVEKIVRTNDQPASLLLQQRIKTSTESVRTIIFECITESCIPLMRNRFGNFLMQRCIECGTPGQVKLIAQIMKGNIYTLSCDRFGCHVVQKAIDLMPFEFKSAFITELMPYVHETIVHRFACHVWQRVFEVKWGEERGMKGLMAYVNTTMKGYWQRIAHDENGSLVVQCIFEHCSDAEKVPLLEELMGVIFDISKGQWGNWVIQHILEHGSQAVRQCVFETVANNIYAMSTDQFASKVVEKALKTAPKRDLNEMINAVITRSSQQDRPHILDMMSNQYANYVVQHILNVSESTQRELCLSLINPHISALKGSKYGQRVSLLVERMVRSPHAFVPGQPWTAGYQPGTNGHVHTFNYIASA